jgi:uncharacterized protein
MAHFPKKLADLSCRLQASGYQERRMNCVSHSVFLWLLAATLAYGQAVANSTGPQLVMVPMRDGVKLATDVYLPSGNAPFPVVLARTPYNKDGMRGGAEGAAKRGYAVVLQDTRGRFASEGENLPFNVDDKDGFDTVEWIEKQGWCNGRIGTYGGSALGITQLQLAGSGAKGIVCQHIAVACPDLYAGFYHGGIFRKAMIEDWLRVSKFSPRALELWTGHDYYNRYWADRDVSRRFKNVNAPALHIGGYYDIFAQGTIDAFQGYQTRGGPGARGKQKLLMGPWTHSVLTDKAGDLVFPNAQHPPNDVQDQFRWWECYLKGVVNGVAELPAVTYYVMGDVTDSTAPGNTWRTAAQWPPVPTREHRLYFRGDRSLSTLREPSGQSASYLYDPRSPAPSAGGYELTIPAGPRDQRALEERPDVLVFTSETLTAPMEVTGQAHARLYISTDVPDTDFIVRLCDVYPDGRSFNISEGALRARYRISFLQDDLLKPGRIYSLDVDLWPTSIVFNRGHRLRVDVTSSSAPGLDPNPNTGERLRWSERREVAHTTIHLSRQYVSHIDLPAAAVRTK